MNLGILSTKVQETCANIPSPTSTIVSDISGTVMSLINSVQQDIHYLPDTAP